MLRLLRIVGIIIFACLIGVSANALWEMHEMGELFEAYNNAPKANLTLLVFSVILLSALGYFEVTRVRRRSRRQNFGESAYSDIYEKRQEGLDRTSIYSTPQNEDAWRVRRGRNPGRKHRHRTKSKQKHRGQAGMIWMRCLQALCVVLPVIYLALLSLNLLQAHEVVWVAVLLPSVFGILFILSIVAAVGIFGRKTWGMMLGYALAVCNLLIFPFGTAIGLILMMGLVGASPVFEKSAALARRKKSRGKSANRTEVSAI